MDVSLEINKGHGSGRPGVQSATSKNGTGNGGSEALSGENTLAACLRR